MTARQEHHAADTGPDDVDPDPFGDDTSEFIDPLACHDDDPCCEHGTCGREDCPNVEPRDTIPEAPCEP